jgi:glycosyltransferase involved in cell wall biosynthesis
LLDVLHNQTYPANLIEVIVVADGCSDGTLAMLAAYNASFLFQYTEQPGRGAAVARNAGAKLATGELLLFLDDDIEPSPGLIEAHIAAHATTNRVVIGYLPLLSKENSFFHTALWIWWEEKYQLMRQYEHRFTYEDLLSGNFSLSTVLFKKLGGFNSSLRCREDYELGVRLIREEVEYFFSIDAWGYHRDEATNLERSFQRKRQEGKADIHLGNLHPDIIPKLFISYVGAYRSFLQTVFYFFLFNMPFITDIQVSGLQYMLNVAERLKMRSYWRKLNNRIKDYWYLRGAAEILQTKKALVAFLKLGMEPAEKRKFDIDVDLKEGLTKAEDELDAKRPLSVRILYGQQCVGYIPLQAGSERLRGVHLRPVLATTLSWQLIQILAVERAVSKNSQQNVQGKEMNYFY